MHILQRIRTIKKGWIRTFSSSSTIEGNDIIGGEDSFNEASYRRNYQGSQQQQPQQPTSSYSTNRYQSSPNSYSSNGATPSQSSFMKNQPNAFSGKMYSNNASNVSSSSSTPSPPTLAFDNSLSNNNSATIFTSTCPFPEELEIDYQDASQFKGVSEKPFSKEIQEILSSNLDPTEIEIKPDGAIYLPESRYRRLLCNAFGPGGWALIPRSAHTFSGGILSREYALFVDGRFISQARGHSQVQESRNSSQYSMSSHPALVSEAVRSNALMRLCKDLGIANELWDPSFVAEWKAENATRRQDSYGKMRWAKNSST